MSVLAFQAKEMEVEVLVGEFRPDGVVGAVVSGGGGVGLLIVTVIVESVVLPAASLAVAVMV